MSDELVTIPYRASNPVADLPPPTTWRGAFWRWLLLRYYERQEVRHERREASARFRTVHMVRRLSCHPFKAQYVTLSACPGKGNIPRTDYDYWLCTPTHCCCERVR